jgi:hypothetical protein
MQIHADKDPGKTLTSQKVEFLHEKYRILCVDNRSQNIQRRYRSLFEMQEKKDHRKLCVSC